MQILQGPLAAVVCLSLVCPVSPAEMPSSGSGLVADHPKADHSSARPAYRSTQLQGDARILHALNRFTFGPRQGDLDAVRAIGLEKWFENQLHPAAIDETNLQAHLAEYPAMQWTPEELLLPGTEQRHDPPGARRQIAHT